MQPGPDEIRAFLASGAAFGMAADAIAVEETHISLVVLAGERAYKLKKPVRFSYLDFHSCALRHAACEREIALNRRTAPDLYEGLVPVTWDGRRLALGGAGEPLDWVIVMRRIAAERRLDRVARDGGFSRRTAERLAESVAALHGEAERIGAPYGGAEGLAHVVQNNIREIREHGRGLADPASIDALEADSMAALARVAPLLDARRAEGWVRRCHGDLHLANVFVVDGWPVPFDCIEFNEHFACVDVLYDLAFLLMDCWRKGFAPQANAILNRYLDRQPPPVRAVMLDGLAAMPLWLSARAGVRAKVAAARGDGAALVQNIKAARLFLTPPPPRLVAVGGLSGSGKTTLARFLAPILGGAPGAVHLRTDTLRKILCGIGETDRLPPDWYTPENHARVYAAIASEAGRALASGQAVVIDAVAARSQERQAFAEIARRAGAGFDGLWCEAAEDVRAGRVGARVGDASDATPELARRQTAYDTGPIIWARIDAIGAMEDVAARAAAALGVPPPPVFG